jgi:hypothetical protein
VRDICVSSSGLVSTRRRWVNYKYNLQILESARKLVRQPTCSGYDLAGLGYVGDAELGALVWESLDASHTSTKCGEDESVPMI